MVASGAAVGAVVVVVVVAGDDADDDNDDACSSVAMALRTAALNSNRPPCWGASGMMVDAVATEGC